MPLRNILILLVCQLISGAGAMVLVTLGGIMGAELSPNPALATLPVSIMVISVAATTIPATLLMRRLGRKTGFAIASLTAVVAVLLAAYALRAGSFPLLIGAVGLFGINMAFTQQYRYAAAESVEPHHAPRAISFVLLGPIGGAFLGEALVRYGADLFVDIRYAGALTGVALLYFIQSLLFFGLGPMRGETPGSAPEPQRRLGDIVRQPVFLVAVLGGVTAYGVMTLIMTATPLSMNIHDGFSLEATSGVIRSHVLGMYVPSLFSGFLIEKLGTVKMMAGGALALLAASLIGLQGHTYVHYWYALIMLGIGWNFLYVGGTTMLTLSYSLGERFKAQAVNEFTVFGTSATASLLAGAVIHVWGWYVLVLLPLPLLAVTLLGLFLIRGNPLVNRLAAKNA